MTGAIRLQAVEGGALAGFPGYVAGLADDEFTTIENQFSDKVQTDQKGHADLSVELPEGTSTRPLQAKLIVDVGEPGGRTVERTLVLPVRAKGVMVGVKKDFDADLSAGDVATFEAIAIQQDGARIARKGPPGRSIRSQTIISGSTPTATGATNPSSRPSASQVGRSTLARMRPPSSPPASAGARIGWT